ncbi:MAG: hypothetical protein HOV79_24460 [Hamadaea sp.]|nr:hypothetical protein [Hamadaea sp.]
MRTISRVIVAGLVATAVFTLYSTLWFAAAGEGFWRPINLVAHTLWRGAPTDGGFHLGAALLGLVVLAVAGVLVMVPYAWLTVQAGTRGLFLILGAAVYANVVWIFGHYLVWNGVDPLAAGEYDHGVAWVGHMLAGLAGGTALALTHTTDPRPRTARERAQDQAEVGL